VRNHETIDADHIILHGRRWQRIGREGRAYTCARSPVPSVRLLLDEYCSAAENWRPCSVRVLFGGGTVGPPDGGSLTPRFVKEFMSVLINERSQMHKRLTLLSSIHAPRMANSSLSSYIIKSPPIAEKARSSRDRILCVASCDEANQHPTQFVVCVLLPAQNTLYPQRHPYRRTAGRTCHRSHVKLVLQNLAVQRGHRVVEPG